MCRNEGESAAQAQQTPVDLNSLNDKVSKKGGRFNKWFVAGEFEMPSVTDVRHDRRVFEGCAKRDRGVHQGNDVKPAGIAGLVSTRDLL